MLGWVCTATKLLDALEVGRSDGPGAATPVGVLTVVRGLKVTVLVGRTGGRDVEGGMAFSYCGRRGECSVAGAAMVPGRAKLVLGLSLSCVADRPRHGVHADRRARWKSQARKCNGFRNEYLVLPALVG